MLLLGDNDILTLGAAGAFIISVLLNIVLYGKTQSYAKYGKFFKIWDNCMKENLPMGWLIDHSGAIIPFTCSVMEKNDALLNGPGKNPGTYTLLTPQAAQSARAIQLPKGPKLYIYPLPYHFPFDVHDSAALCELGKRIEQHPRLSRFHNTIKILELCFNQTGDFETDCRNYIRSSVEYENPEGGLD
jgi:hypothetical protein